MISVIIITKNEGHNMRACLESVMWADEIVIVDSHSTDDTVAICKEYTNNIVISDWHGFGPQKNIALDNAKGDWILSLDADERVDSALQQELIATSQNNNHPAWLIPRRSRYCGRFMRHSGWYPDYVLRFFKKNVGRFSDDLVHERVITTATTQKLKNPITHYPMDTLDQAIDKMNLYSTLAAKEKYRRGQNSSIGKAISHGIWTFIRVYFFKLGILDGRQGFMLAISNAGGSYYKYLKLLQLHQQDKP